MNKNYEKTKETLNSLFTDVGDFRLRETCFGDDKYSVAYISNYSSKTMISKFIIAPITDAYERKSPSEIPYMITSAPVDAANDAEEAEKGILSGSAFVFSNKGTGFGYLVAVKNEEGRSTSEPETENVIRGAHEGFTESAENNAVLIRRRLKTAKLKKETFTLGEKSHTDVSIMYIKGTANEETLQKVRKRLSCVKLDSITESGFIELYIQDGKYALYPSVGNSERPDKIAAKLLEGRIAIICDGSPVVLTVPYLFIEGFQVTEDYSKSVYYATFVRVLRFIAFLSSIFLPALFIALYTSHRSLLPSVITESIDKARENLPFSVFWELILFLLIFELVREVGLRMPKAVGAAVGIVGSLILGDSAIEAGLASAPVLIVAATAAICNFIVPPYMNPNVAYRFFLILVSGVFGLFGMTFGAVLGALLLCAKSSFGVPYLYPIAPVSLSGLSDFLFTSPYWSQKHIPSALTGKKLTRAEKRGGYGNDKK